ncbi:MAG: hypothetical protein AAFY38_12595 [Pseudomonadota bacterium]
MTEMTASPNFWMPRATGPRYVIDPVAFFVALIGAPLLITALTFWMLLIPVAALVMGGPLYLILGTPLLLWFLRRNVGKGEDIALLALGSVIAACAALFGLGVLMDEADYKAIALIYGGFGILFGPAWAATFAFLYNRLRNDLSRRPQLT